MEICKKLLMLSPLAAAFVLFFGLCPTAFAGVEASGEFIRIILKSQNQKLAASGIGQGEWKREAWGDGAIEEVSADDYFDAAQKELSRQLSKDEAEAGAVIIPDPPVPGGYAEFYFKAARPGMANLLITCSSPGRSAPYAEARFTLSVSSDLKVTLLDSSEKYDWGDL